VSVRELVTLFAHTLGAGFADVHLTNVAVQKTNAKYDPASGGKMNIRNLKLYFMHKYGVERTNAMFMEILMIMIRSLLAVQKIIWQDKVYARKLTQTHTSHACTLSPTSSNLLLDRHTWSSFLF
jgi:hypothetical protein